jgi:hypothetical protein
MQMHLGSRHGDEGAEPHALCRHEFQKWTPNGTIENYEAGNREPTTKKKKQQKRKKVIISNTETEKQRNREIVVNLGGQYTMYE